MFRILGSSEPTADYPVILQHGFGGYAGDWLQPIFGKGLPISLTDRGYDVWLGDNRGVTYSNMHDRDGEWSLKERWEFTFAEMGRYDMPAQIEKVLEIT